MMRKASHGENEHSLYYEACENKLLYYQCSSELGRMLNRNFFFSALGSTLLIIPVFKREQTSWNRAANSMASEINKILSPKKGAIGRTEISLVTFSLTYPLNIFIRTNQSSICALYVACDPGHSDLRVPSVSRSVYLDVLVSVF